MYDTSGNIVKKLTDEGIWTPPDIDYMDKYIVTGDMTILDSYIMYANKVLMLLPLTRDRFPPGISLSVFMNKNHFGRDKFLFMMPCKKLEQIEKIINKNDLSEKKVHNLYKDFFKIFKEA